MRILILGGTGMLGHKIHETLARDHEVVSTVRRPAAELPVDAREFLRGGRVVERVDVTDLSRVRSLVEEVGAEAVINCVGVIKQREEAHDAVASISVNALLPHQLARICGDHGVRFITFSTDCVFSGHEGDYKEDSFSDAVDLYGRTKYLGEVSEGDALTIRTSIIGRELDHFQSLVEWFLRAQGTIRGYTRAIYTGVTTIQIARLVGCVLEDHRDLAGVYQVASRKITKFELLMMLQQGLGQEAVNIEPFDDFQCDRSLNGEKFLAATGLPVPPWPDMVSELAKEAGRYEGVSR